MRPLELTKNIILHDSSIESISLDTFNRTLSLQIELCNYMQPNYQDQLPEIITGKLKFFNVSRFEVVPEKRVQDISGQIIKAHVEYENVLKLTILTFDFSEHVESPISLSIISDSIIWYNDM